MKGIAFLELIFGRPCTTMVLTMVWSLASSCSLMLMFREHLGVSYHMVPPLGMQIGRNAMEQTRANGRSTLNVAPATALQQIAPQQAQCLHVGAVLLQWCSQIAGTHANSNAVAARMATQLSDA